MAEARRLVMEDGDDERGRFYRAVILGEDGSLTIEGQDIGAAVQRAFGQREYEFERTLSPAEMATLRSLLDVPADGDLLAAIAGRFDSTVGLEQFVRDHGIGGSFWNRIGD